MVASIRMAVGPVVLASLDGEPGPFRFAAGDLEPPPQSAARVQSQRDARSDRRAAPVEKSTGREAFAVWARIE